MILLLKYLFVSQAFAFNPSPQQKCADYPRVAGYKLGLQNKCLGLALTKADVPWGKPRRLAFKDENTLLVADMGTWGRDQRKGVLWEVNLKTKEYKKLYTGGDWTHGLAIDSKKRVLVGDADKIVRVNSNGKIEVVIDRLPTAGTHPLSHFILLPNDDLVLNIGASSNDCKDELKSSTTCTQRDLTGHLRLYKIQNDSSYKLNVFEIDQDRRGNLHKTDFFARGLRNSMALAYNPVLNEIYQVENNIDTEGTFEEFNIIPFDQKRMHDYGWPFCVENGRQTKVARNRFKSFCSKIAKPASFLIPPHSAPLDMMYYNGKEHPELRGQILMTWHGRRRAEEHGLVSYATQENGAPLIQNVKGSHPYTSLIAGISQEGNQPKFYPVGMATDVDGKIWIADDKNNALLIYASSLEEEIPVVDEKERARLQKIDSFMQNINQGEFNRFATSYSEFYKVQNCTSCHNQSELPSDPKIALKNLLYGKWFSLEQDVKDQPFFERLHKDSVKPMPPFPDRPFRQDHPKIYEDLKNWALENLK